MTRKVRPPVGTPLHQMPDWAPHERPMMAGSPATPYFPPRIRLAYGLVAVLLGVTGSLGTALVSVNLPAIQGDLGLDPAQGAWLNTVYVTVYVSMNLLVVKYRQQYGLIRFVKVFLTAYAAATVAHLFSDSFASALTVRAVSGVVGAAMGPVTLFYMLQAFPPKFKPQALILGIGVAQFGIPLARVISPVLLDLGDWHGVYAFEAGLALACLAAVSALRVPAGFRIQAFERKDAVSFALFASGFALLVAALGLGRISWWLDAPWVGWSLAGSIALIAAGATYEHYRENPLIDTRWIAQPSFLRFIFGILVVRILLSEQTYAAPGLMQAIGMGPEQMQQLFAVVLIASILGVLFGAFSLLISPGVVPVQMMVALALIAVGGFMDARATIDTHPAQLFVSQSLLGFSSAMFMGAAMMTGLGQLIRRGFHSIITFSMTVGVTQIMGGVLGGAIFSTLEAMRAAHHAAYLSESVVASNPATAHTLQAYGGAYASTVVDPALRSVDGAALLAQQAAQQANVLAFNDIFLIIAVTATAMIGLNLFFSIRAALKARAAQTATPA